MSPTDDVSCGTNTPPPLRRLNCLIVVPSLGRAGAETQAVQLANGLSSHGHSVHLGSFKPELVQRSRLSETVRLHHVQRMRKYDWSLISRLSEVIDNHQIEVVQGVLQFGILIATLASWRSRTKPPVVAAIHTTLNRDRKQEILERTLYRRLLRRLPAIVFVCEYQKAHWIRKYPDLTQKSTVVYNGIAPEAFCQSEFAAPATRLRDELSIPEKAVLFACIAAFRPEKGHDILLEAFSRVKGMPYLVLAGDGEFRGRMEAKAEALGLGGRVRFLGNIPDTRPLIVASNATVLASTAVETFSMAMLESMALGVPMIAPVIGGLPEAIIDGETGLLFPIGDTDALAAKLQSVVDDRTLLAAMGGAARQRVVERFTLANMITGTERVMRKVLEA